MTTNRTSGSPVVAFLFMMMSGGTLAYGQLSGFASISGGYQSNPLFNYQNQGDQIYAGFLELGYVHDRLSARYTGALTMFNRLSERNYLDHTLSVDVALSRGRVPNPEIPEDSSADGNDPPPDSLGIFGTLGARLATRQDKKPFKEYNNRSAFLTGSLFHGFTSDWHYRFVGEGGLRSYPSMKELSNATVLGTAELGFGRSAGWSGGGWILGGYRYYATATFDTSVYVTTASGQGNRGKGKGNSGGNGQSTTTKKVLSNAERRSVLQVAGGLFAVRAWDGGSAKASVWYRTNASGAARILARTAETATINEDLYNDFLSYEGPEGSLSISQELPLDIQATFTCRLVSKSFGAPAFDLEENQTAATRKDRHAGADLYLSRYCALSGSFGMDLALSGYLVRNASNDQYNDFHAWGLSLSVGFGL